VKKRGKRRFGTTRQLPGGKWQARHRINGRLVAAPWLFNTDREASAWLASVEVDMARGNWFDHRLGKETLSTYTKSVIANRVLEERTRQEYQRLLRLHILPTLGDIPIDDLDNLTVRGWHARTFKKHPTTSAKAYRLLMMVLNQAVNDGRIGRNRCVIKGAGKEDAPERPTASVAEVNALTEAIPERFAAILLVATWCQLRRGEFLGLRRGDVDLLHQKLTIQQTLQVLNDGTIVFKGPKSKAGRRTIAIPSHIIGALEHHLATFVDDHPDSLVFGGEKGGPLRPLTLHKHWDRARKTIGRPDLHLHDLRHTGATWAAATGASTKELMARMGHDSPRAALIYQHASEDRDRVIAEALAEMQPLAEITDIRQRRKR
jgi:integrase